MDIAFSINNIPIRLTAERWLHIVENHDDVAGYYEDVLAVVESPELLLPGHKGSLYRRAPGSIILYRSKMVLPVLLVSIIAVRNYGHRRYLLVIYREISAEDGFIVTAFFTNEIDRKKAIWKLQ
ncbi:MAG: hypothetical protein R3C14_01515 [Caldilineaceae bacterium]